MATFDVIEIVDVVADRILGLITSGVALVID